MDLSGNPIVTGLPRDHPPSTNAHPTEIERIPVLPANTYVIRKATVDDEQALRRLAELDSQRPLSGPVLIGEIDGRPAAAVSLEDGRAIADPFAFTVHLSQVLRIRAAAIWAHSQTPSLPARLRAAIGTVPAARATEA